MENQEVSILFREKKLNWLQCYFGIVISKMTLPLVNKNSHWFSSIVVFCACVCIWVLGVFFWVFVWGFFMLSTWTFQVLHASEVFLFIFLSENQKVRHQVDLCKGMRGVVHKPASRPHQQLQYCYSNDLHILSDVTDFVQPEAAFVWVGDEGRKLKKPSRAVVTVFHPRSSNHS